MLQDAKDEHERYNDRISVNKTEGSLLSICSKYQLEKTPKYTSTPSNMNVVVNTGECSNFKGTFKYKISKLYLF